MKRFHRHLLATVSLFSLATIGNAKDLKITDFKSEKDAKLGWQVVDDGVMGGLSQGKIDFSKSGILRFAGKLSLENNGGFSSLRTGDIQLDLSDFSGLKMRVKGDGRTYQVRIASDARYRGMEVSFGAGFATQKGKWIEVKVPFADLVGGWRGRSLEDEVFNPAKIQRLGLILADKQAGDFKLEVDWIHAYSSDDIGNLVDQALADGRFKTLATALTEAQLVGALQGDGPFTVFAPTDEAFSKLPKGTVESLLKPENREQLQSILKYHVIAGEIGLAGALEAGTAKTLQGDSVSIAFAEGNVRVNEAAILNADLKCSNGVIHVIDSVLMPSPKSKKNDAKIHPAALIEKAIHRGVPAFNHGDHAKCAKIYQDCLKKLADDEAISKDVRTLLKEVLEKAGEIDGDPSQAWLFRRALDLAYHSVAD